MTTHDDQGGKANKQPFLPIIVTLAPYSCIPSTFSPFIIFVNSSKLVPALA